MDTSKTGSGRRRWTSKQRQRLLTRFHQNEMTQREFATRYGVGFKARPVCVPPAIFFSGTTFLANRTAESVD
jgi:hypothetical protein